MTLITEVTVQLRADDGTPVWTYSHVEAVAPEDNAEDLFITALSQLQRRQREAKDAIAEQSDKVLKESRGVK